MSPVTTVTPIVVVLGLAMAKDAVEDYKRHKQDSEVNATRVSSTVFALGCSPDNEGNGKENTEITMGNRRGLDISNGRTTLKHGALHT